MESRSGSRRSSSAAIRFAGGAALCGVLLITWLFYWASQHDSGDEVGEPYPIALTHGVLGALVVLSLVVAWSRRRISAFRRIDLLPLALAAGYAGTVLWFALRSLV